MGYKRVRETKKQEKRIRRIRRKRIDKAIAKVNSTPSRVDISGSTDDPTAIIHRISLKLYTEDLLLDLWFWFFGLVFGAILTMFVFDPFKVVTWTAITILPEVSGWIGLSMGLLLYYAISLLWFVIRFRRPIRIRIHDGIFYFDDWDGKQLKGKVSKTTLKLSFEDRFIEDGWVELDIKLDTYGVFYMSSRDAFRLKL